MHRQRYTPGSDTGFIHPQASEITPPTVYHERRALLQHLATGVAGAALASWAARDARAQSAGASRPGKLAALPAVSSKVAGAQSIERITDYKDASSYNNFYEFSTDKAAPARMAHTLVTRPWSVEIAGLAREAGHRTKIAVRSTVPGVNAKGACIGPMGQRVRQVMSELGGEKIDIVDYSEDPAELIGHALSPARVSHVEIVDPQARAARVTVPDYQLSLAIGKEGQNARLAARLTGWRIDIRPDTTTGADESGAPGAADPGAGSP